MRVKQLPEHGFSIEDITFSLLPQCCLCLVYLDWSFSCHLTNVKAFNTTD
jgi:hypothetical protein